MFFFELSIGGDLPSSITDFLVTFFISIIAYIALIIFSFFASGGLDELMPYYYYFD